MPVKRAKKPKRKVAAAKKKKTSKKAPGLIVIRKSKDKRAKWYVVHTFTGHEDKVKASVERRAKSQGLGDRFGRILVPTEEELRGTRRGRRQVSRHKVYPGYDLCFLESRRARVYSRKRQLWDTSGDRIDIFVIAIIP